MSQQFAPAANTYFPPMPVQPPQKPKSKWKLPLLFLAVLLFGAAIGTAAKPSPPIPEPVVKTVFEEKRIEVPVTPTACIKAIDLAQQGFTYAAESMGYMNNAIQAAGKRDLAGLQQANADLEKMSPKTEAITSPMKAAVSECRAGTK